MENTTISSVPTAGSRYDARMAISAAVAKMPRHASFETTPSGGTRASFRPSVKPPSKVAAPQTAPVKAEVRKHHYPTHERVVQLLVRGVKRNLDHGMGRPQALDAARRWLADTVIATNEDLKEEDRTSRLTWLSNLDVADFWKVFDERRTAKTPASTSATISTPKASTTAPVHTSEFLLAALAGADQVTAGDDSLDIPDEVVVPKVQKPVVQAKPATAPPAPRADRRPEGRSLTRLPLTTPGHLGEVAELFIERYLAKGLNEEEALRKACNRLFYEIDNDKSLSKEDAEDLNQRVRAKLPRREKPAKRAPSGGMVFMDRARPNLEHKASKPAPQHQRIADLKRTLKGMKEELENCFFSAYPLPHTIAKAEQYQALHTELEGLLAAEAARATEKKAERAARAEASARKSRTLGECQMRETAPKPKKEGKKSQPHEARAE